MPLGPRSAHLPGLPAAGGTGAAGDFDPASLLAAGTLPAAWGERWAAEPDAAVLVAGGETVTAGRLDAETRAAASALAAAGLVPGSRLLWSTTTSVPAVVACLAALRLGAVVVPANAAYTERELAHIVRDVRPTVAVLERAEQADWVARAGGDGPRVLSVADVAVAGTARGRRAGPDAPLDAAAASDPALIVYTSGTTGAPKGAVLSHANLAAGARSLVLAWGWTPEDRLVLTLPLFHVHGLCAGLFGTLAAGASAVLASHFDPGAVLEAAGGGAATMFFGVPTLYHRLLASPRAPALARLRLCVSGSAPLPAALWWRARDEAGVSVLERYGMTETLLTLSNPLVGERRPGTVGFPLPGVEARIEPPGATAAGTADDAGALWVRGPSVFSGYWERPAATAECFSGGWFRTGDLAALDPEGYYCIRGRSSDLVISGGYNVYPAEVEDVLLSHPGVAEAAVAGVPSDEWGESVAAWVVTAGGPLDAADLLAYAAERLAPYKRPRAVHFVEDLPRNALGKVQRGQLR